jgi:hypothetical protein
MLENEAGHVMAAMVPLLKRDMDGALYGTHVAISIL